MVFDLDEDELRATREMHKLSDKNVAKIDDDINKLNKFCEYEDAVVLCEEALYEIQEAIETVLNMLKEKDKEIDLMANFMIAGLEDFAFNTICKKSNCIYELKDNRSTGFRKCKNCIKQYFEKQTEQKGE